MEMGRRALTRLEMRGRMKKDKVKEYLELDITSTIDIWANQECHIVIIINYSVAKNSYVVS